MRSENLFLAAVAIATLSACSTMGTFSGPSGAPRILSCPGGVCPSIDVIVNEVAGGRCELAAIPDLSVVDEATGEKSISWLLPESGFEWSKEEWKSALFVQGGDDPVGRFGTIRITMGGRKLEIRFAHVKNASERKVYKYALSARRTAEPKQFCKTLDPWIIS